MRIALVAPARFPVREPFAGGLEAMVAGLAAGLRERGHEVSLFAAEGSDGADERFAFPAGGWDPSELARADVSMPAQQFMSEHHAYLRLMLALAGSLGDDLDVVHDHSLHYLPMAMAGTLRTPLLTTLHTPPTPWLEAAHAAGDGTTAFSAVSRHTAQQWAHVGRRATVVANGVDLGTWRPGPGGDALLWSGRMVPEKAPQLAIEAARRAGHRLRLAGPISDRAWFRQVVRPLLGPDVEYVGHLTGTALAALVGASAAVLVTPDWEEPSGLVAAEALACGTPVVAFARGGLPEVLGSPDGAPGRLPTGALVAGGDTAAMAAELPRAVGLDRTAVHEHARLHLSRDRMVDDYVALYRRLSTRAQSPVRSSSRISPASANAESQPSIGNQPQRARNRLAFRTTASR
ncbi:glycosyltransferase [Angustibacter aerolatus]